MTEETKTETKKKKYVQKPNPLDGCDRDLKAKVVISQLMRDLRLGQGGAEAEKDVIVWFHSRYPLSGAP